MNTFKKTINKSSLVSLFNRNAVLVFLTLMAFNVSCSKDFFELERPPEDPWLTLKEFERAPIGVYNNMFAGDQWNICWVNAAIVKNCSADDVSWAFDPSYGYERKTKEFNTYTDKAFMPAYRTIAAANLGLEFVAKNNGNPYPGESAENITNNLNRIIGELHFMRGYAYFLLETTFGHAYVPGGPNSTKDIPMPTMFAKSASEAKSPVIGTTQQVWDLILSDLTKAKELLPEMYIDGKMHKSYQVRASKFAASAMLMRTYFQRGEYDKALKECDFIIDQNKGQFDLTEDPIEAFNKSTLARGKEVIFYAPYYDRSLVAGAQHLSAFNHTYENNQICAWTETRMAKGAISRLGWMVDPENDTSFTVKALRDKRFTQVMAVRYPENKHRPGAAVDNRSVIKDITTIWCWKYFRGAGLWNTNVPLIRLAEVYLTRSILRFKNNDKQGAADDLNMVRKRAWNVAVGGAFVPVGAAEITSDMINDERLVEMFCETDRLDYLRGLKVDIPKGERGVGSDPYTSESFVWAIPQRELNYNESF